MGQVDSKKLRDIYIPVLNLNDLNFDYGDIDMETFDKMLFEHLIKNGDRVDRYIRSRIIGRSGSVMEGKRSFSDYITVDNTENGQYVLMKAEAMVTDRYGTPVSDEDIRNAVFNKKPVIFVLDIKTDEPDYDISSELKYWIWESDNILKDKYLPNKTKIKTLPKTHFLVGINTGNIKLNGCKLVEMYKERNKPYKFAVLVSECKFV